jgi:hypothetical protein
MPGPRRYARHRSQTTLGDVCHHRLLLRHRVDERAPEGRGLKEWLGAAAIALVIERVAASEFLAKLDHARANDRVSLMEDARPGNG